MIPELNFLIWFLVITLALIFLLHFLLQTSLIQIIINTITSLLNQFHIYNLYKIPQFNDHSQENPLFRKILTYIKSLPSLEDSGYALLYSGGNKPGDILVSLDSHGRVTDTFLHAKITWVYNKPENKIHGSEIILKIKSKDKKRILLPYIQHIYKVVDEIEQKKKELRVYLNRPSSGQDDGLSNLRWRSFPFVHPSSLDNIVLDNDVKLKVKNDLDLFLKSKQYYTKIGRVWKRSYLLYGGSGTGKSSFAAAMAKFLSYDLYDIDLSKPSDGSDLKTLLLQTSKKALVLVENLDGYLMGDSSSLSLSSILNFMDGVVASCGEERVMVFTMNCKDHIDPFVLRPGRVDVHIHFPFCDFNGFKGLAMSHLGVKEHKLFSQVEDLFLQNGSRLSPAEISEIMIANRVSPTKAIKVIIQALQSEVDGKLINHIGNLNRTSSDQVLEELDGDSIKGRNKDQGLNAIREIQKMYGKLRLKNSKRGDSFDLSIH